MTFFFIARFDTSGLRKNRDSRKTNLEQTELVQREQVSESILAKDYLEGLALAQLAPGPLAAQLAVYLGYIRAGVLGATAVGVVFVLPSFLVPARANHGAEYGARLIYE